MNSMTKLGNKIVFFTTNFTSNRPLCFLSTLGGIRDFLIGLGFLLGLEEIRQTRLFQNYDELLPGYSGLAIGALFIAVGLFVSVTATLDKTKYIRLGLRFQAFAWLFSAIMYFLSGEFLLGLIFGIFFSAPAGYLAFYYKYNPLWIEQRRIFRDNWIEKYGPAVFDKARESR